MFGLEIDNFQYMENYDKYIAQLFYKSRYLFKTLRRNIFCYPTNSFCKNCGRDIHDFIVSDEIWENVEPYISNYGHTLCYDCFCEICPKIGLSPVWRLEKL